MNKSNSTMKNSSNNRQDKDDVFGEVVVHHENRHKFCVSPTPTKRKMLLQRNRSKSVGNNVARDPQTSDEELVQPKKRVQFQTARRSSTITTAPLQEMRRPIHYPNSPKVMSRKSLSSIQSFAAEHRSPGAVQRRKRISSLHDFTHDAHRSPGAIQRKRVVINSEDNNRSHINTWDREEISRRRQEKQRKQPVREEKKSRRPTLSNDEATTRATRKVATKSNSHRWDCNCSFCSVDDYDHYNCDDNDDCFHQSFPAPVSSSRRNKAKKEREPSEKAMKILMEHHHDELPSWLRRRIEAKMRRSTCLSPELQPKQSVTPASVPSRKNNSLTIDTRDSIRSFPIQPLPF